MEMTLFLPVNSRNQQTHNELPFIRSPEFAEGTSGVTRLGAGAVSKVAVEPSFTVSWTHSEASPGLRRQAAFRTAS